jgi:hypothetical protein
VFLYTFGIIWLSMTLHIISFFQLSQLSKDHESASALQRQTSVAELESEKRLRDTEFSSRLETDLHQSKAEAEAARAKALGEQRAALEGERTRALTAQAERLERRTKQELEAMRTKFKMMANSGALDSRSPSASESELSMVSSGGSNQGLEGSSLLAIFEGERKGSSAWSGARAFKKC